MNISRMGCGSRAGPTTSFYVQTLSGFYNPFIDKESIPLWQTAFATS